MRLFFRLLAALSFAVISILTFQSPAHAKPLVAIDPGHGGWDSGAVGPTGYTEKEANLDIGMRTRALLIGAGYRVLMTRTTDISPNTPPRDLTGDGTIGVADDLQARVNMANGGGADIFVSIHNNAAASGAYGTETYWATGNPQAAKSQKLAVLIQQEVLKQIQRYDRGVKSANFWVLRRTSMPAALLEGAFISNPTEESLLKTAGFRQKIAVGVYNAVGRYFKEVGGTTVGFTETLGVPQSRLAESIIFPWYDMKSPGTVDWLLTTNLGWANSNVVVWRDDWETLFNGTIAPLETLPSIFSGKIGGPLEVRGDRRLAVTQRVQYHGAFSEVPGVPAGRLGLRLAFPWYDQATPGMTDGLLVANPRRNRTTNVRVLLGANQIASGSIAPGRTRVFGFPGKIGGPLQVVADQRILASQRVLYQGSFEERMATPGTDFSTHLVFPWYDNVTPGMSNWLLVANPGRYPTDITVKLGGRQVASRQGVRALSTTVFRLPGSINGPLEVFSTRPVVAGQRVHYYESFNDLEAVPSRDLAARVVFPWYDQKTDGMKDDWLLIGNPAGSEPAEFTVRLEGITIATGTVDGGRTWAGTFPGKIGGPLEVISGNGVKLAVSQRVHYVRSYIQ